MSLAPQSTESGRPSAPKEGKYWLALLGGALAWLTHLLFSYTLGEFGCESALATYSYLGINAVAWGLMALTLLTALAAAGSIFLAYRLQPSNHDHENHATNFVARVYASRAGLIADVAFLLIILVESVPILYYLQQCH